MFKMNVTINQVVICDFKVRYGKWISKRLRAEAIAKNPTNEYLDWLYNYFEQNLDLVKVSNS